MIEGETGHDQPGQGQGEGRAAGSLHMAMSIYARLKLVYIN